MTVTEVSQRCTFGGRSVQCLLSGRPCDEIKNAARAQHSRTTGTPLSEVPDATATLTSGGCAVSTPNQNVCTAEVTARVG